MANYFMVDVANEITEYIYARDHVGYEEVSASSQKKFKLVVNNNRKNLRSRNKLTLLTKFDDDLLLVLSP